VQVSRQQYQEAVAALKELLAGDADETARMKYCAVYERAMVELGRATEAYNEAREMEAEGAFVDLAGAVVIRPDAKEQLPSLIAAHEKRLPDSPNLDYYRGELAALHEKWAEAVALFKSGFSKAPDDAWKDSYRPKLVWAMYKAGQAVAAHDEFAGDESVFMQLINHAEADKNVELVEALIAAAGKRHADPKYLHYWRARAAALKQDWPRAVELLAQNTAELDALPRYKWRARELHVRALLKIGAADEARSLAKRHWEEDKFDWTSLVVAVLERNIPEAERWIKRYEEDPFSLQDLFADEGIAAALQSEAFKPLREKYEWLRKAAAEAEK
jgi:hypothetical protein